MIKYLTIVFGSVFIAAGICGIIEADSWWTFMYIFNIVSWSMWSLNVILNDRR